MICPTCQTMSINVVLTAFTARKRAAAINWVISAKSAVVEIGICRDLRDFQMDFLPSIFSLGRQARRARSFFQTSAFGKFIAMACIHRSSQPWRS